MAKSAKWIVLGRTPFGCPLRFLHYFSSVLRQMTGYLMHSWGTACTPPLQAQRIHFVPTNSRMYPACDRTSLGSKPRQLTIQSIPPITKFSAAWAPVFSELSQASKPSAYLKLLAYSHSPLRNKGVCYWAQWCDETQEGLSGLSEVDLLIALVSALSLHFGLYWLTLQ